MMNTDSAMFYYPMEWRGKILESWANTSFTEVSAQLESLDLQLRTVQKINYGNQIIIHNGGYFPGTFKPDRKGISVLMPIYKGEKYLSQLFATLARQTLTPELFEAVFVINGENGQQLEKLQDFAKESAFAVRILCIDKKNESLARNISLAFALRQYFCNLDADDTIQSDYLLGMYECANPTTIVLAPILCKDKGRLKLDRYGRFLISSISKLTRLNMAPFFTNNAGKLVPTYMVRGLRYSNGLLSGSDVVFWLELLLRNKYTVKSSYKPGRPVAYVRHVTPESVSRNHIDPKREIANILKIINRLNCLKTNTIAEKTVINAQSNYYGNCVVNLLQRCNKRKDLVASVFIRHCQNDAIAFHIYNSIIKNQISTISNHKLLLRYYLAAINELNLKLNGITSIAKRDNIIYEIDKISCDMLTDYGKLSDTATEYWNKHIYKARLPIFNKSKFGAVLGIAFCYNFPPSKSTRGYISSRRLTQLHTLYGQLINWHCFVGSMSRIESDEEYVRVYGRYQYNAMTVVPVHAGTNLEMQLEWGRRAAEKAMLLEAKVIYSASWKVGSHLAALRYKDAHPEAYWYAEFGDPLYIGPGNEPLTTPLDYKKGYNGSFYAWLEAQVFKHADYVILTNVNQKRIMLESNPQIICNQKIGAKCHAIVSPRIPRILYDISPKQYKIDKKYLNIGYFGALYKDRNINDLINIANKYDCVKLHLFIAAGKFFLQECISHKNIVINDPVSNLNVLNIAKEMDMLYIEDLKYAGNFNPYIPSKLWEYIGSGTTILINFQNNSIMSKMQNKKFVPLSKFSQFYSTWLNSKA